MPSAKRQRQRAARQARQQAVERSRRRRSTVRRVVVVVVIVALAGGIYAAVRPTGKNTTASKKTSSTTTIATTGTSSTTTIDLAGYTTSADCPSPYTATSPALKKPSWHSEPPLTIDTSANYTATVTTDVGSFTIALDAKAAPHTVNNFVFLAENHFYDCVVFHRVINDFMDQTGDPTGTGSGGPGYEFANENGQSSYTSGEVAMANSGGTDTNGSQFFVLVAPYTPPSGDSYSLFGTVTSGMSVVKQINNDGSSSGTPAKLHRIISISISES